MRSLCRVNFFVGLARAAVLRRRSVTIDKLPVFDDHEERDRLWLGIHRPDHHCFHTDAKSSPGNAVGLRKNQGTWMGGKERISVGADHGLNTSLTTRLPKLP